MYYKYLYRRLFLKAPYPVEKPFLVGMAADTRNLDDLRFYLNGLSKQLNTIRSLQKRPAQCPHRLIANKDNSTLFSPKIVFKMMPDSSCLTHSGSRNDHFRLLVKIDGLAVVAGDR